MSFVAVVTGANSGIGLEFCKRFAAAPPTRNATLVMACRRSVGASEAHESVQQLAAAHVQVELVELDLADLASVRRCGALLAVLFVRVDLLLLNAGVMFHRRERTADALDRTLQINCFGHFLLWQLLQPLLDAAPAARVVVVSSVTHWLCRDVPEADLPQLRLTPDLGYEERVYCLSKLLNLLFVAELHRRLRAAASRCIAVACHPGWSKTMLMERPAAQSWWYWLVFRVGNPIFAQSAERGALPLWEAAFGADVVGGDYLGPDGCLFGFSGANVLPAARSKLALDTALAQRVWARFEQIVSAQKS